MRYPATNEPLLRGLFLRGPIPLDRRADPSPALRRQVPFLFLLFRGSRAFGSGSVFHLRWTAGFPRNRARAARQDRTCLFESRNF